jgi:hypothetical protein
MQAGVALGATDAATWVSVCEAHPI